MNLRKLYQRWRKHRLLAAASYHSRLADSFEAVAKELGPSDDLAKWAAEHRKIAQRAHAELDKLARNDHEQD